jgi:hypothetical protein
MNNESCLADGGSLSAVCGALAVENGSLPNINGPLRAATVRR